MQDADPAERVAVHSDVDPVVNATEPVGVDPALAVTVAAYVTVVPWITEVGETVTVVVVAIGTTFNVAVPDDGAKLLSPEYEAVTVSVPTGAEEALQLPDPLASVALQMVADPMEKVTVPVGVPDPNDGVTVAEYCTLWPTETGVGVTEATVTVAAVVTVNEVVADDAEKLASPV